MKLKVTLRILSIGRRGLEDSYEYVIVDEASGTAALQRAVDDFKKENRQEAYPRFQQVGGVYAEPALPEEVHAYDEAHGARPEGALPLNTEAPVVEKSTNARIRNKAQPAN